VSQPRYQAFISYSHRDAGWAAWLHRALETYRVPKLLVGSAGAHGSVPARLAPIFRDREELASASDLGREISASLADSANLIVICSPHAAASRWVNEEVLAFKRLGRAHRIFCLIVDGEPNASDLPGRTAEECFCPALRFALDDDGTPAPRRCEPIAADIRRGGDGRANAKLKIVAGLLGVGLDALRQREHHRQQRRMLAITAAALLVMGVTSMLAVAAVVAREAAERRQKQAEELVGFMLGDLGTRLREVNRLDIIESVAEQAMHYYGSLPPEDVTDVAMMQRAQALQKIAHIRLDRGNTAAALEAFTRATPIFAGLAESAPHDVDRQLAHAGNLNRVGKALWVLQDFVPAAAAFAQATQIIDAALAVAPDHVALLAERASLATNAGRLAELRRDSASALAHYEAVLKTFRRLQSAEPENERWQLEIGYAHNNLGKLALSGGDLKEAARHYRLDLDIKRALATRRPDNNQRQAELAAAYMFAARVDMQLGENAQAEVEQRSALEILTALGTFDPTHVTWRHYRASGERHHATILIDRGELDGAAEHNATSRRLLEELLAKDADNGAWRLGLADSLLQAAEISLLQHRSDRTFDYLDAAARVLPGDAVPDRQWQRLKVVERLLRAEATLPNDADFAAVLVRQAAGLVFPIVDGDSDPEWLELATRVAITAGDSRSAERFIDRLARMGFARVAHEQRVGAWRATLSARLQQPGADVGQH